MIGQWSPRGFSEYRKHYAATPALKVPAVDLSERFIALWEDPAALTVPMAADTTVLLLRGFLAAFMPGNLVRVCQALGALGFDARMAGTNTLDSVQKNSARIAEQLRRQPPRSRLILLGHSKGGHEALTFLLDHPAFAAKCAGVAMAQSTRGASLVLESMMLGRHRETLPTRWRRFNEGAQSVGLGLSNAKRGGRDLVEPGLAAVLARIDGARFSFPIVQTVSWSTIPTSWLDAFHERLGEIRPGCANDGQFYLEDLFWPDHVAHVLLPELDHAQPAMGGHGFDEVRFWIVQLRLMLTGASSAPSRTPDASW